MNSTKFRRAALTSASAVAVAFLAAMPGQAYAQAVVLGGNVGDDDTRTVGTGQTLAATELYVGQAGQGTLTVTDGGSVHSSDFTVLGQRTTGVGTVTVAGGGSSLSTGGILYVGYSGRGTLEISSGATVSAGNGLMLGGNRGAEGSVTVSGVGSRLSSGSYIYFGDQGLGTADISNGGTVASTGPIRFGVNATGVGVVTVTGTGSSLSAGTAMAIGDRGRGTLTVSNGGAASAGGILSIGAQATGVGTVTVTGAGSSLVAASELNVGYAGWGSLTIADGATASSTGESIRVGWLAGSDGSLTVTGADSSVTAFGILAAGVSGRGTVTLSDGGTITATDVEVGYGAGAEGSLTVTGTGSLLTSNGDLFVGRDGNGRLALSNGGTVNVQGVTRFGLNSTGIGTVTVDGVGSSLTTNGLTVGELGNGALTISNGGRVASLADASTGGLTGTGVTTVTGTGSTLTVTNYMGVGDYGNGTLDVNSGGTVRAGRTLIGSEISGVGAVTVSGPGSSLTTTTGNVVVGYAGRGTLTVSNSGNVTSSNLVRIGYLTGSTGTLSIGGQSGSAADAAGTVNGSIRFGAGDGQLAFNHNSAGYVHTGTIESEAPGAGRIRFEAGNTTLNTNGLGFTGTSEVLSGALLNLNGSLGGTLNVRAGGELSGVGTIGTLNAAGVVRLGGNNAIGQLTGTSATFSSGSLYVADFVGNNSADSIVLSGTATIASGSTLRVVTPTGATYRAGDRATVLSAAGGLTGRFTLEGGARPVSAFLTLRDGYSATQAYLEVAQTRDFATAGQTANQRAAGRGLQSLGSSSPLFNAVANMQTDAPARVAFDALSGEIHPGTRGVLARDAYRVQQIVVGNSVVGDREAAGRVWASAWAADGHLNGDGNAERLDHDTTGIFVGADVHVGGGLRLGAAVGYDEGKVVSSRGEGRADISRKSVQVYFDGALGGFSLRGGVGYTEAGIKAGRVAAFTSPTLNLNQRLAASYDGSVVHAYLDASYAFALGKAQVAPFANLSTASAHTKAFTETGGNAALSVAKATTDLTYSTAGVRVNGVSMGAFDLSGSAGWRHAFGDLDARGLHRLPGGAAFTVLGPDAGRDAAVLDLNLNWRPSDNFTIGAGVGLVSGDGTNDRNATVSLRYSF